MGIRSPQTLLSPGSQISPRTVRPGRAKDLAAGLAKLDTEYKKERNAHTEESEKTYSSPSNSSELDAKLANPKELKKYINDSIDDYQDDDFEWNSEM